MVRPACLRIDLVRVDVVRVGAVVLLEEPPGVVLGVRPVVGRPPGRPPAGARTAPLVMREPPLGVPLGAVLGAATVPLVIVLLPPPPPPNQPGRTIVYGAPNARTRRSPRPYPSSSHW